MSAINFTVPSTPQGVDHKPAAVSLKRAEWRLICFILAIFIAGVVNTVVRHQAVAWTEFVPTFAISIELVLIGIFIRKTRHMPRLAMGTIGFGLFMCFSGASSIFIFTLFPLSHPLMDPALLALDAKLGFSWVGAVNFIASYYPAVGIALRYVYLSILPQIGGVIVLLSFLNREVNLHRFLTVGFLGLILTIGCWWTFPSVGPAAYGMVSTLAQESIQLNANASYGAYMRQLATEGLPLIAPERIAGVVAFPSFHIVLTCMVLWFTRSTWAFLPLVILNLAMPVATVVQGGHHLVDLIGGFAMFGLSLWITTRLVPEKPVAENGELT